MGREEGVELESRPKTVGKELVEEVCFGKDKIRSYELGVGSKAFIQPQVSPPFHCDKVTKPLVGQLVSNNIRDVLLVSIGRCT